LAGAGKTDHQAAVLVLLTGDPDPVVLLTRRAAGLRHHAGQVSFPGGTIENGEGVVSAALREAAEEVGLEPAWASVLGELPSARIPVSRFAVAAVVAWWDGAGPVRAQNPAEVASVEQVAVSRLADPATRLTWVHPSGRTGPGFAFGDVFVWGFTAAVLDVVLKAGGWERPWQRARQVPVPELFLPDERSAAVFPTASEAAGG
jgi:8-oxo-dGTP pyrophosphatase MutT (NUDIX family)